jgi:hypothetical protein
MLKERFIGDWVSALPFDSGDYLVEYSISMDGDKFVIKARDLQDGEKFKISGVQFDGISLQFASYMPSTKRKGIHQFKLKGKNRIGAQFTFTVVEDLKRVSADTVKKKVTKLKNPAYAISKEPK